MEACTLDSWTAVISEASATTIEKLSALVDFANPPSFYDFALQQWQARIGGASGPWELLMDSQSILIAVGQPAVVSLPQAIELMRCALQSDGLFDTKLIRKVLANRLWPEEVPSEEVMRVLEVLESLDDPQRLAMTLLKFAKFPNKRVQSKVCKILGRCVDSTDVMEELFQNPDGRVRANLLEGIGRRDNIDPFLPIIEKATKDQHTRVSSIALAIRAKRGHSGATALIKMRRNSKMDTIRKSAEFAERIAAGEAQVRESDRAPEPAPVPQAEPQAQETPGPSA